ncbi:hypothetical protein AVEN_162497-1 [Araneus ventricosus]|uniref:Uncharacterized protein n=1 Tax=Araneus ventricosus TaxID=182803 RepID=A0A4Y2QP37_ARAVE|nr:hypothetical protein AVEN_236081-1 [Araneus ventricosus]GBN65060.1 hypothetical protein AVEN_162497-1 [Araneus ventricosus]
MKDGSLFLRFKAMRVSTHLLHLSVEQKPLRNGGLGGRGAPQVTFPGELRSRKLPNTAQGPSFSAQLTREALFHQETPSALRPTAMRAALLAPLEVATVQGSSAY